MTQPLGEFSLKCKFCAHRVEFGIGILMVETSEGSGFICHEECFQQSGEDGGAIEAIHNIEWEDINEDN
jgi:hypothetical protein